MSYWNEKLGYVRWASEDFINMNDFNDFQYAIDVSDDSLNGTHIRALLNQALKLNDRILIDKITDYIAQKTPIKKRTLNQIIKDIENHKFTEKIQRITTSKDTTQKFTEEEIEAFEEWLNKEEHERYEDLDKVINFYVKGKKDQNNVKLIYHLKFGDLIKRPSRVNYHGDPSGGKSYGSDTAMKLIPEERVWKLDGGSDKIFRYREEPFDIVYLREMKQDMNMIEDLKSVGDDNSVFDYVDFNLKKTITKQIERAGILTTYSFETTQRDYEDRSWNIIPDQSHKQNIRIKKFRLEIRKNQLERYIEEKEIIQLCQFLKDVVRYFVTQIVRLNVRVIIPYSNELEPLLSDKFLKVRRDVDKLPDLIETITIFNLNHRFTFEYDNQLFVISEFADLHRALSIGLDYFILMSSNLDPIKKEILDFMKEVEVTIYQSNNGDEVENIDNKYYTLREIHDFISKEKSQHINTTRNKMKNLVDDGYLSIRKERGKATLYHKLKDYEDLKLDLDEISPEINRLVETYKNDYKLIINEKTEVENIKLNEEKGELRK